MYFQYFFFRLLQRSPIQNSFVSLSEVTNHRKRVPPAIRQYLQEKFYISTIAPAIVSRETFTIQEFPYPAAEMPCRKKEFCFYTTCGELSDAAWDYLRLFTFLPAPSSACSGITKGTVCFRLSRLFSLSADTEICFRHPAILVLQRKA